MPTQTVPTPAARKHLSAEFDVKDSATWPVVLTAHHMAAIFHKSAKRMYELAAQGMFQPAPIQGSRPPVWRRVDVLRMVEPHRKSA